MIMSWFTTLQSVREHRWFSGRMLACHAGGPGSIPGRCKHFFCHVYAKTSKRTQRGFKKQKCAGDGGYRSPYLSHAKRALYHLSYVPMLVSTSSPVRLYPVLYELVSDLCPTLLPWQGWWRCAFQGHTYGPYTCADIGATVSTTCTLSASAAMIGG